MHPMADGVRLALRHWEPTGTPRGTVLIVHGLGEHSGRYEHVAAYLTARGWRVVAYDLRGHGRSEGRRGSIARSDDHLRDLTTIVDLVRSRPDYLVPDTRLLLLGHSMGGAFAAQFVARAIRPIDGLILSSPALDPGLTAFQRMQLRLGMALMPGLALPNQLAVDRLSHDPAVVADYQADPLVHDRVTPRLAQAIVDAGEEVIAQAPRWHTPTLLLWAGDDRNVAPAGSARFAEGAPSDQVTARVFPAIYHEIFAEPDADLVFTALGDWLDRRFT
jgi:alpha-beta hydrolase superfamily lysophospholipase